MRWKEKSWLCLCAHAQSSDQSRWHEIKFHFVWLHTRLSHLHFPFESDHFLLQCVYFIFPSVSSCISIGRCTTVTKQTSIRSRWVYVCVRTMWKRCRSDDGITYIYVSHCTHSRNMYLYSGWCSMFRLVQLDGRGRERMHTKNEELTANGQRRPQHGFFSMPPISQEMLCTA